MILGQIGTGCEIESLIQKTAKVLLVEEAVFSSFHLIASIIFLLAVIHTLSTHKIRIYARHFEERHAKKSLKAKKSRLHGRRKVSFFAETLHFLSEVEVVFGVWTVPLFILIAISFDWTSAVEYINTRDYTEALYVVVIMIVAATRPLVVLAENVLHFISKLLGDTVSSWWLTLLTIGPIFGSFITEPAAMVLTAVLLSRQFYIYKPNVKLAYATIGLLFVNVSVGGVLTNFAAPPVLVVARCWNWSSSFMFFNFGILAIIGVILSNLIYLKFFLKEFRRLNLKKKKNPISKTQKRPIPIWITCIHVLLLIWVIINAHYPAVIIASLLLFLGFMKATSTFQGKMHLKRPLLVGAFIGGLIIHGGLQQWWVTAVLQSVQEFSLMALGVLLSAFVENAAVTYLASLSPDLSETYRYLMISSAIVGGGLTVMAHAANPAGLSLLEKYYKDGVAPLYLFLAALPPTIIFFILYYAPVLFGFK